MYAKPITKALLCLCLMLCHLSTGLHADEQSSEVQAADVFRIGGITTINSPPYNWVSRCEGDNKAIGSTHHLMDKIFSELNINVEYAEPLSIRSETIRTRFRHLKEGNYDAITGVLARQAKNGIVIGEVPLVEVDIGVLYKKQLITQPTSLITLKSYRGAIPFFFSYIATNNLGKEALDSLELKKAKTLTEAIELLLSDQVDYVITNSHRARITTMDMEVNTLLDYKSLNEFTLNSYLAVKEGSRWEALLPQLDQRLKEARESGYVDHIEKTYLISWQRNKDCSYDDL